MGHVAVLLPLNWEHPGGVIQPRFAEHPDVLDRVVTQLGQPRQVRLTR
jgi:hypothetical protein